MEMDRAERELEIIQQNRLQNIKEELNTHLRTQRVEGFNEYSQRVLDVEKQHSELEKAFFLARVQEAANRGDFDPIAAGKAATEIRGMQSPGWGQRRNLQTKLPPPKDLGPAPFQPQTTAPAPPKTAASTSAGANVTAPTDTPVMTFIQDNGGIIPKSKAGATGGEYDGAPSPRVIGPKRSAMIFGGTKLKADQMAQQLFNANKISAPTPEAMWDAIRKEAAGKSKQREFFEDQQSDAWQKNESDQVSSQDLSVGEPSPYN